MKFDARKNDSVADLITFVDWLRSETVSGLKRSYGDREGVNAVLFLFANRAYEAHLREDAIWQIAGEAIGQAGYSEQETEGVISILEGHANLSAQVHADV